VFSIVVRHPGLVPEKAAAPSPNSAAAQLDNFCCAKIWTRTVLAESPELGDCAKRGLIFSGTWPGWRTNTEIEQSADE